MTNEQKLQKKFKKEDPRVIGETDDDLVCVWRTGALKSNTYALGYYPRDFVTRYGPTTVVKWVMGSGYAAYLSHPAILHTMFPDDAVREDIIDRLRDGRFVDYPRLQFEYVPDTAFGDRFNLTVEKS